MKTKVIYVAGLYHTGSTLLDMILGNLPNVIGLGEIFKGFHDKFEEVCSCGQKVENCDFWGEILSQINSDESMDMRKKYEVKIRK